MKEMKIISSVKKVQTAPRMNITQKVKTVVKKVQAPKLGIKIKTIGISKSTRVARHMFLGSSALMPKISLVAGYKGKAPYMAVRYSKRDDSQKYSARD